MSKGTRGTLFVSYTKGLGCDLTNLQTLLQFAKINYPRRLTAV